MASVITYPAFDNCILSGRPSAFTRMRTSYHVSDPCLTRCHLRALPLCLILCHFFFLFFCCGSCAALDGPSMEEQHPGGLNARVDEGGSNWSTGQRQLICLARAVLRAPKVLAIDEATANIDLETDAIVQQSIRSKFKDSTCLTIAHRLQTILDSDLIVTMDAGKVAEVTTLFFCCVNLMNTLSGEHCFLCATSTMRLLGGVHLT